MRCPSSSRNASDVLAPPAPARDSRASTSSAERAISASTSSGMRSTASRISGAAISRSARSIGSISSSPHGANNSRSIAREGRPHGLARLVSPLHHARPLRPRKASRPARLRNSAIGIPPAECRRPDGDPARQPCSITNPHRLMIGAEDPRVIHFREIVVFRRQPEHGNGRNAALRQFPCEPDRRSAPYKLCKRARRTNPPAGR